MWVTFTQATTGYGESVPITHIGRAAAVVVMLFMPIVIAFITIVIIIGAIIVSGLNHMFFDCFINI